LISLKKYLDMEGQELRGTEPDQAGLLPVSLEAFRTALQAMAESGARACPAVGSDLQQNLTNLAERLGNDTSAEVLAETGVQTGEQLRQWGDRTAEHFKAKTAEVKELLLMLARTAESVGERDQEYNGHFQQLTSRLHTISNLEDLTQVRSSLVQQASELVAQLKKEVSTYETKLKKIEELARRDALTGLANRRSVEERIEARIAQVQVFCVVVLDLNKFKQVNDHYGHLGGDNLLQQFSQELRSNSRSTDLVGRWGGDEFILVMDCNATGAIAQIERIKKWALGSYTIRPGKGAREVKVLAEAAVGYAEWQRGETMKSVIDRADAAMYREKGKARAQHA
jgi:diguanylate cyclase (GGDEF)-like protein